MGKKRTVLSLEEFRRLSFEERLSRLERGLPLKLKRTKPRDPQKRSALIEFFTKSTPPAQEILSGKAFSKLFQKYEFLLKGKL